MTTVWKSKIGFGLLLIGATVLSACANGPTHPSAQLAKSIAAARTPADHEALAKYYDGEASANRARVKKYQKLASSTTEMPTGGRGYSNPKIRYKSVIDLYEAEAAQYEVLANQQRELAKTPVS